MKKVNIICIIFVSIFLLSANDDQPQEKYYYGFDEKIPLYEAPNKVVVCFDEKHLSEIQTNLRHNAQILSMDFKFENNYAILTIVENANVRALKEDLKKLAGIKSVNPLYHGKVVTDEIIVQFKEHVSQQEIDNIVQKYRLVVNRISSWRSHLLSVPIDFDLLEVTNAIQESGLVNYSHPNFYSEIVTL